MSEITNYLGDIAAMESGSRAFARFVLDHGIEWESQGFDGTYTQGIPRRCYGNAQDILFHDGGVADGLVYVEGYACSGSLGFAFPTQHAWLVDPQGRVIDPTWDDPETSTYFGVPFNHDYVRRTIRKAETACSLIDNFHDRWQLVSTPSVAQDAVMRWEVPAPAVTGILSVAGPDTKLVRCISGE